MIEIYDLFPECATELCVERSEKNEEYNCIAFAMHDTARWWWPTRRKGAYWPPNAPVEDTIGAFAAMLVQAGFSKCDSSDYENGFTKVALYAIGLKPTHLARQSPNGIAKRDYPLDAGIGLIAS
jgi:hypothetical protein